MIYSEASYGPNAYHFAHIAARDEAERLARIERNVIKVADGFRSLNVERRNNSRSVELPRLTVV